ncbi:hypothetical protein ABK040_004876 [Willaertia magna]
MIQPLLLPKVLNQINTDGIKAALLCNVNGALLSSCLIKTTSTLFDESRVSQPQMKHVDKLIAAIAANMWQFYNKSGKTAFSPSANNEDQYLQEDAYDKDQALNNKFEQTLKTLLVDCEYGRLAIMNVSKYVVLCVCSEKTVPFGLLKTKTKVLRDFLEQPFQIVDEAYEDEDEEEEY